MWTTLAWVALGGAAGACSRAGVSWGVMRLLGGPSPWGTFAVNMVGSFCMGAVFALVSAKELSSGTHTLIAVGFLGSFTTFSSFALDQLKLLQAGQLSGWLFQLMTQNVLGLLLVWCGWKLAGLLLHS